MVHEGVLIFATLPTLLPVASASPRRTRDTASQSNENEGIGHRHQSWRSNGESVVSEFWHCCSTALKTKYSSETHMALRQETYSASIAHISTTLFIYCTIPRSVGEKFCGVRSLLFKNKVDLGRKDTWTSLANISVIHSTGAYRPRWGTQSTAMLQSNAGPFYIPLFLSLVLYNAV